MRSRDFAGGLYAYQQGFVWPSMMGVVLSTQIVLYCLFGGIGTLVGSALGVIAIEGFSYAFSDQFPKVWPILLGVLLLLVILLRPSGIISLLVSDRERVGNFRPRAAGRVAARLAGNAVPLLEARGIVKSYGELRALDGVHLSVEPQQIHGLIGPNGSGKSTLLKCVAGAERPDAGGVTFEGIDITAAPPPERARAGISIKFQITSVLPGLSVFDNVLLALQARDRLHDLMFSRTRRTLAERVLHLLGQFRLAERADALAGELSHGQQQWLEIVMALAPEPRVLLLDEPTAGMSLEERRITGALLRPIVGRCSIVIVEHDLDFIRDICDRLTVLDQGRVLESGTVATIQESEKVREVYLTRV